MSLLCYGEVLCFFLTLRPSDLTITLTYVLMDNVCPCFCTVCFSVLKNILIKSVDITHTHDNSRTANS